MEPETVTETTTERKVRERKNLKRKRKRLHRQWKSYLSDSRLTPEEQKRRAIFFTRCEKIPKG